MHHPLSHERLSELIAAIYDCAIDPLAWPELLDRLLEELCFSQGTLSLQALPSGRVLLKVATGIAQPWLDRIDGYGTDILELWGGVQAIAAAPLEEPLLLSHMNPEIAAGTSRNRYYLEWRKPQGIIDTLSLGLSRDTESVATASFVRHESQGAIGMAEVSTIRLLAPHLRRAVTISRLLEAGQVTGSTFHAVLERLITPILIVDSRLRLIHANAAAQAALDRRRPLAVRGGQISAKDPAVGRALMAAVVQAAQDESGIGHRGFGIPALGPDGGCALHVLPLGGTMRASLAGGDAVGIFIASATTTWPAAAATLSALFGLTEAEQRVCDGIISGSVVSEIAADLGVNVSTVRTHLLRIYQKVGVRRQAELMKMAATLHSPVR